MLVFKTCFKVFKKHRASLMIYVIVFATISIMMTTQSKSSPQFGFVDSKSNIAFISAETDSPLVAGFESYLNENTHVANLKDDKQTLQDALFFGKIDYIVRVPAGFTANFLSGKNDIQIEKTSASGSVNAVYTDLLINRYLETASLYVKNVPGISESAIVAAVAADLTHKSELVMNNYGKKAPESALPYYFSYFSYICLAILMMSVTTIMMVFNSGTLKRRNTCAPISSLSMNLQLILANLVFGVALWALMLVGSCVLFKSEMISSLTPLYAANSLVFTLVAMSLAYLVTNFVTKPGAQSAASNVVSLGMSFLSGVFVPQALLGKSVLKIASFTPTYWYVKAINVIKTLPDYSFGSMKPIYISMLVEAGFAGVFIALSLLVAKQRRTQS